MEKTSNQKAVEFTKGKSGNAKGMQKGTRSWSGLIKEYGQGISTDGKTRQQLIVERLFKEGMRGSRWAIECIIERVEGKALSVQQLDVTTGGQSLNAAVSFHKAGEIPVQASEVKTVDALPVLDSEPFNSAEIDGSEEVKVERKKIQW